MYRYRYKACLEPCQCWMTAAVEYLIPLPTSLPLTMSLPLLCLSLLREEEWVAICMLFFVTIATLSGGLMKINPGSQWILFHHFTPTRAGAEELSRHLHLMLLGAAQTGSVPSPPPEARPNERKMNGQRYLVFRGHGSERGAPREAGNRGPRTRLGEGGRASISRVMAGEARQPAHWEVWLFLRDDVCCSCGTVFRWVSSVCTSQEQPCHCHFVTVTVLSDTFLATLVSWHPSALPASVHFLPHFLPAFVTVFQLPPSSQ